MRSHSRTGGNNKCMIRFWKFSTFISINIALDDHRNTLQIFYYWGFKSAFHSKYICSNQALTNLLYKLLWKLFILNLSYMIWLTSLVILARWLPKACFPFFMWSCIWTWPSWPLPRWCASCLPSYLPICDGKIRSQCFLILSCYWNYLRKH